MKSRIFAAIELPAPVCAQLGETLAGYQAQLPKGSVRWVNPTGIHLTLRFYGDTLNERIPEVQATLAQAAQAAAPMELTLQGLGLFPNAAKPQVVWVGLAGALESLERLQQALEATARTLKYPPETRPFTPHLTLGRVPNLRPEPLRALLNFLNTTKFEAQAPFRATGLSLMKSQLRPTGSVYTQLAHYPFGVA